MCAHLVARWSREEILNIFLYKNSPGWSGQECFLSPFKNLYNPAVRIIQGLEHQNLWANSGAPEFMCLLHIQPPFLLLLLANCSGLVPQRCLKSGFLLSTARLDSFMITPSTELKAQISYVVCREKQQFAEKQPWVKCTGKFKAPS